MSRRTTLSSLEAERAHSFYELNVPGSLPPALTPHTEEAQRSQSNISQAPDKNDGHEKNGDARVEKEEGEGEAAEQSPLVLEPLPIPSPPPASMPQISSAAFPSEHHHHPVSLHAPPPVHPMQAPPAHHPYHPHHLPPGLGPCAPMSATHLPPGPYNGGSMYPSALSTMNPHYTHAAGSGPGAMPPGPRPTPSQAWNAPPALPTAADAEAPPIKTGKFSKSESQAILHAVQEYCEAHDVSVHRLCSENAHRGDLKGAWLKIAKVLPNRTVQAVYRHGLRKLHSFKRGKWTEEEERKLMELVEVRGQKWVKFQEVLNRSADACRDKHRELATGWAAKAWARKGAER